MHPEMHPADLPRRAHRGRGARMEAKSASSLRSISRLNSSSVRRRVVGASRFPPARDVVMDVVSGPSRTSSQRMKSGSAACSRPRTCRKASSSASIASGSTTRSLSGPGSRCSALCANIAVCSMARSCLTA
eukprot:scaffold50230_cov75-Phaeocystis_antarctica.AAC.1